MSSEKIDRIMATYKPVANMPGYVWMDCYTYVKASTLREAYEEAFKDEKEKRTTSSESADLHMDFD